MGANGDLGRYAQEIFAVLAGVVGDAADHALLIEKVVVERGYRAHVNAAEDESATFAQSFQGGGNDFARGCKHNGGIELNGWLRESFASPFGSQVEGEFLVPGIAGGGVNVDVPVPRDLNGNVGGSAASVKAELAAGFDSGKAQAAEADNSGAKQRGGLLIGKLLGNGIDKVLRCNNVLGVASIDGVAGEGGVVAKIFRARTAILAGAVGTMQPSDANPRADGEPACAGSQPLNDANDLVTRDYR